MKLREYFSNDELQFVYLVFRHYTRSLPPRDVILQVLELRIKVVVKDEGLKSVHTEKDGRKHGLEQQWYLDEQKCLERTWKDGNLDGLEQWWWCDGRKHLERTWKDGKKVSNVYSK